MRIIYGKTSKGIISVFLIVVIAVIVVAGGFISLTKIFFPTRYGEYVFKYSQQFNIDPYLVFAVIKAESGFNPHARSKKDAKGLMQITDSTGQWILNALGRKDFSLEILFDPEINIMAGTWYLSWLSAEFDNDLNLVISAYNCGHGRVKEWLRDTNISKSGITLDRIPFPETDNFTRKVLRYYRIYRRIYAIRKFFQLPVIPA